MEPVTYSGSRGSDHLISALLRRGVLQKEHITKLQLLEFSSQKELEQVLLDSYPVVEADVLQALAEQAKIPVISLRNFQVREDILSIIPSEMMVRNRIAPIASSEYSVTLAISDPLNLMAVEEVAEYMKIQVMPVAALESEVLEIIKAADQGGIDALDDMLKKVSDTSVELSSESHEDNVDIDQMIESAGDAPVVRIVNMILVEAMRLRASDIHIEPFEREVKLRYRVDGALQLGPAPPKTFQSAIVSRLKVMSELDIAERRIPQDGRFRIKVQGRKIDLRVSMLPTIHGEKIVLRVLDKSNLAPSLDVLGLAPDALEKLRHAISQPHGLILVTGPTGSGKTTTLYSALQELNKEDVNIVTVENPVEYQLTGINQVEIHTGVGMTFSAALRSILRQDPDIVLVGETRDAETAGIAVKAALTGHLVLTTLHTNDAPGAVVRLVNMGVDAFLISSALLLSQAQRLVRRLCPNCKIPFNLTPQYCENNSMDYAMFEGKEIFAAQGCSRCNKTGYKGRASVMEVLLISLDMRNMILKTDNAADIKELALKEGFADLRVSGFHRVIEGITSVEEVLRVTAGEV